MSNLDIWSAVEKTDPKHTKPITGKPYKGTSTNATHLAKRATELFGPCGIGWGVKVLNEGLLEGAPGEKIHRVHIQFWYVHDGKRGEVEHFGQTEFCGTRNSGKPFTDEDAPKKSLTDAMTKAMSLLGFAADIHLGMYDDNKYVTAIKEEFAEAERAAAPPSAAEMERADYISRSLIELANFTTAVEVKAWWAREKTPRLHLFPDASTPGYQTLYDAFAARGKALAPQPAQEAAE